MNEPLGEREVLCVSQFTLYGDTRRGNRPSYVAAAAAELAEPLYERFCERLGAGAGVFGAHMEVELVNDGPVTLLAREPRARIMPVHDALGYSYLFTQLVRRELRRKYKGSSLGVLWYLVNPLVLMAAYTLMFGHVFKLQSIPDFPDLPDDRAGGVDLLPAVAAERRPNR